MQAYLHTYYTYFYTVFAIEDADLMDLQYVIGAKVSKFFLELKQA